MHFDPNLTATRLARRGLISLRDRVGEQIECLEGSLWITQEGDVRDVVLEAGNTFTLDRQGTAIVYALADARLIAWPPAASQEPHTRLRGPRGVQRALAHPPAAAVRPAHTLTNCSS